MIIAFDPGSNVGWVALSDAGKVLDHGVFHASESSDDGDSNTVRRLRLTILSIVDKKITPLQFVAEQPVDAKPFWSGQKGNRREGTGTAFRSGVYYGMLRAILQLEFPGVPFTSWPIHGSGRGSTRRHGWMPPTTKREYLLTALRHDFERRGGRADASEHEIMAFGVGRKSME